MTRLGHWPEQQISRLVIIGEADLRLREFITLLGKRGSSDRVHQSVALRHFGNTWRSNALQCLLAQQLPRSCHDVT
jgi:hypothetical protein